MTTMPPTDPRVPKPQLVRPTRAASILRAASITVLVVDYAFVLGALARLWPLSPLLLGSLVLLSAAVIAAVLQSGALAKPERRMTWVTGPIGRSGMSGFPKKKPPRENTGDGFVERLGRFERWLKEDHPLAFQLAPAVILGTLALLGAAFAWTLGQAMAPASASSPAPAIVAPASASSAPSPSPSVQLPGQTH